jgi:hypothetical protein
MEGVWVIVDSWVVSEHDVPAQQKPQPVCVRSENDVSAQSEPWHPIWSGRGSSDVTSGGVESLIRGPGPTCQWPTAMSRDSVASGVWLSMVYVLLETAKSELLNGASKHRCPWVDQLGRNPRGSDSISSPTLDPEMESLNFKPGIPPLLTSVLLSHIQIR